MISANSRNTLTALIFDVSPTGALKRPAFVDLRARVSGSKDDDRSVTVDTANSWASISLQALADGTFWWAIADLSSVIDPFEELAPGRQLILPSAQRMLFDILAPENSQ